MQAFIRNVFIGSIFSSKESGTAYFRLKQETADIDESELNAIQVQSSK